MLPYIYKFKIVNQSGVTITAKLKGLRCYNPEGRVAYELGDGDEVLTPTSVSLVDQSTITNGNSVTGEEFDSINKKNRFEKIQCYLTLSTANSPSGEVTVYVISKLENSDAYSEGIPVFSTYMNATGETHYSFFV